MRGATRIDAEEIRDLLPSSDARVSSRGVRTRPTRDQVERALRGTGGNISKAAALLGVYGDSALGRRRLIDDDQAPGHNPPVRRQTAEVGARTHSTAGVIETIPLNGANTSLRPLRK